MRPPIVKEALTLFGLEEAASPRVPDGEPGPGDRERRTRRRAAAARATATVRTYRLSDLPDWIRYWQRGPNAGQERVRVDPESGCWRWLGTHTRDGYGHVGVPGEGNRLVHRVVFALLVGPIPDGLQLDHVRAWGCVHRDCLRPDHLEPVTSRTNTLRGDTFAARQAAQTHCVHGHPFDLANTRMGLDGKRACRACHRRRREADPERERERDRRRYLRRKAAKAGT